MNHSPFNPFGCFQNIGAPEVTVADTWLSLIHSSSNTSSVTSSIISLSSGCLLQLLLHDSHGSLCWSISLVNFNSPWAMRWWSLSLDAILRPRQLRHRDVSHGTRFASLGAVPLTSGWSHVAFQPLPLFRTLLKTCDPPAWRATSQFQTGQQLPLSLVVYCQLRALRTWSCCSLRG
jgi:hypothetical protein